MGYNYEPIDAASAAVNKRRTMFKWIGGGAAACLVLYYAFHRNENRVAPSTAGVQSATADSSFAGLLMDNKGFYFPLSTGGLPIRAQPPAGRYLRRRSLEEDPAVADVKALTDEVWAADWDAKNAKDLAAIGEYYKAKADSLKDGSFDWTADWKEDDKRGAALGDLYAAIGAEIDEHYTELYASPRKAGKEQLAGISSAAETEDGAGAPATTAKDKSEAYNWMADRDRGIAIGQHYANLSKAIEEHYAGIEAPKPTWDYGDDWQKYRDQGKALGDFYKKKGEEIAAFYNGTYVEPPKPVDDAVKKTNPEILEEKGDSVEEYYRALLDPNYAQESAVEQAKNAVGGTGDPAVQTVDGVTYHDQTEIDARFAPWGQDHEADLKHRATISAYWKLRGKAIGTYYKTYGKALGKYYHDYYHGVFSKKEFDEKAKSGNLPTPPKPEAKKEEETPSIPPAAEEEAPPAATEAEAPPAEEEAPPAATEVEAPPAEEEAPPAATEAEAPPAEEEAPPAATEAEAPPVAEAVPVEP